MRFLYPRVFVGEWWLAGRQVGRTRVRLQLLVGCTTTSWVVVLLLLSAGLRIVYTGIDTEKLLWCSIIPVATQQPSVFPEGGLLLLWFLQLL